MCVYVYVCSTSMLADPWGNDAEDIPILQMIDDMVLESKLVMKVFSESTHTCSSLHSSLANIAKASTDGIAFDENHLNFKDGAYIPTATRKAVDRSVPALFSLLGRIPALSFLKHPREFELGNLVLEEHVITRRSQMFDEMPDFTTVSYSPVETVSVDPLEMNSMSSKKGDAV